MICFVSSSVEGTKSVQLDMKDRVGIQDWLSKYADVIDRRKFNHEFDNLFTTDAIIDYSESGGRKGTVAEIRQWLQGVFQFFGKSQHLISNVIIHNATEAGAKQSVHVSAMFFNPMNLRYFPYEPFFTCGGWYHHEFIKTEQQEWKSKKLSVEMAFNNVTPNLILAFLLFCYLYFYILGSGGGQREKLE